MKILPVTTPLTKHEQKVPLGLIYGHILRYDDPNVAGLVIIINVDDYITSLSQLRSCYLAKAISLQNPAKIFWIDPDSTAPKNQSTTIIRRCK